MFAVVQHDQGRQRRQGGHQLVNVGVGRVEGHAQGMGDERQQPLAGPQRRQINPMHDIRRSRARVRNDGPGQGGLAHTARADQGHQEQVAHRRKQGVGFELAADQPGRVHALAPGTRQALKGQPLRPACQLVPQPRHVDDGPRCPATCAAR